ncbi:hypothetical protein AGDE_14229 [Angomonas deanei]|uniref:Peroxisomal membrane protein PEX14 n=1 Tax=Angomonas deanei TaxID=59799 RepID=A0A7G2CRC9_9TRYP|nr:hypothetical protein AGDE_14229 [Angomonas deanei]CAD2221063.1 Peroxisomal membrane anchor protein (Pex14p) conserved region containing protein, putative [Angomonas deanei]|eukprot:EPY21197.1 hypothetical protein AGDE_14229 [Angomonas deanei]
MDVETPQGEKSQRKEELDNNPAVRSAIAFLNDPRVKRTPTDRKIKFLKGKGLSSEEIKYAFEKCGLPPLTLEQISAVQPLETGTGALSTPSSAAANPSARSAYLFPQSAPAPVESEAQEPSLDWRGCGDWLRRDGAHRGGGLQVPQELLPL